MGHEGIRLAFYFHSTIHFAQFPFLLNIWQELIFQKAIQTLRSVFLPRTKIVFECIDGFSSYGRGSFSNCRSWDHNQLLQNWTISKESYLPEAYRSPWISCCSTQDLHWLVQLAPYLPGHLLLRAGQSDATVFPSPPLTAQRGFKRTKNMGH